MSSSWLLRDASEIVLNLENICYIYASINFNSMLLYRDCKGKIKGGTGWNLRISGIEQYIEDIYLIIPKRIYMRFCMRFVVLNRSYSTNTQPIWKWLYPTEAWESQICSCYSFFYFCLAFLIDIIDNITTYCTIHISHQNFHQWQSSILVTWYRQRHV